MDFNAFPKTPNAMKRNLTIFICVWLALEGVAFWAMFEYLGGMTAAWTLIGSIALGWAIQPRARITPNSPEQMAQAIASTPKSYWPRKLAAFFFIMPTYLTSLVGILMLIAPLRKALQNFAMKCFLPPALADLFTRDMQDMRGKMNPNAAAKNEPTTHSNRSKNTQNKASGDCIDIDYEIDGAKTATTAHVNRTDQAPKAPKAIEAEIIDVDHEWR